MASYYCYTENCAATALLLLHCGNKRTLKRRTSGKKLSKHATRVLRKWLYNHIHRPYPDNQEKKVLAHSTGLTIVQINNWFANARRRKLRKRN